MEEEKSKKILFIVQPFKSALSSFYELIEDLISLDYNVTIYILEEFKSIFEPTGARLKTYIIDKTEEINRLPPAVANRAVMPLGIAKSYIPILDDVSKSQEQYDFLMVDSFYDGNEMNKILKIPTVITLYTKGLGDKSPFVDASLNHIKQFWIPVNKKLKLNIKDFYTQHFSPDTKYKLMLTSKLFHPESEKIDDSFFFIGPSFYIRPRDTTFEFNKDLNKKLIYISFGITFNINIDYYKFCIQAFGNSKKYQVIMSIGENTNLKELGDIPGNFHVYNYVPQLQVLEMADVFINRGGEDSINEAIFLARLPIIVIPMLSVQENAKLIGKLKAGILLDKDKLNPKILNKAVDDYLSNKEEYLKGVDLIAESFEKVRNERKSILKKILS